MVVSGKNVNLVPIRSFTFVGSIKSLLHMTGVFMQLLSY